MSRRHPYQLYGNVPPPPPPPPPPPGVSQQNLQQPQPRGRMPPPYSMLPQYGYSTISTTVPGQSQPQQVNNPQSSSSTTATSSPASAPPSSSQWTCAACAVTLDSAKAYRAHRKSHVQCSDCDFQGVPKVVKAHYMAQHGKYSSSSTSGFKTVTIQVPGCRPQHFSICVGNAPADIQRWIAERKKKFPRQQSSKLPKDDNVKNHPPETSTSASYKDGKAGGGGLSSLLAGYGSSSSEEDEQDEEEATKTDATTIKPQNPEQPAESATMDPATGTSTPIVNKNENNGDSIPPASPQQLSGQKRKRPCRFFFRNNGSCIHGDACRFSHEGTPPSPSAKRHQNHNNNQRRKSTQSFSSSDTLLRKLLQNDQQRESSLCMQLLQHIVKKDFFQHPQTGAAAKK